MVSIIPGIDNAEPDLTETSSGLPAAPNVLPVAASTLAISSRISAINPAGISFAWR